MPIYAYRCADCGKVTDHYCSSSDAPLALTCEHCQGSDTRRIIAAVAYHASEASKTARLDPRYEKKVDRAMRNSASADPDRVVRRIDRRSTPKP